MEKILIAFKSFPKDELTCLHIINWGVVKNNKIEYITNNGLQLKTQSEIENTNIKLCKFEDLNIKNSLYWWYRENGEAHSLPIEIDYTISTGEIYQGNLWRLKLMIQKTETTLKVKPIFED